MNITIRRFQKNWEHGKYKKTVRIVGFVTAGICMFMLGAYYAGGRRAEKNIEVLRDIKESGATDDFDRWQEGDILAEYQELFVQNPDLTGWLTIEGTGIDYPIMWTPEDPEYYSHRGFDREESANGLLFMDEASYMDESGGNVIIYGHNMKNGSMFADLVKYENESFARNHSLISMDTLYEKRIYEVVAVMKSDDLSRLPFDFTSVYSPGAESAIKNAAAGALYDMNADYTLGDDFLTLATCEYDEVNGRLVVFARRVR